MLIAKCFEACLNFLLYTLCCDQSCVAGPPWFSTPSDPTSVRVSPEDRKLRACISLETLPLGASVFSLKISIVFDAS